MYSFSPTFIERQNVSDVYGDDSQAFFLTASQNDWELGEGQRWFRSKDPDRVRRYWLGTNIDPISIPGQVAMRTTVGSLTFAAAALGCAEATGGIYTTTATNLYLVDSTGAITDKGAHGLGATPSQWGVTSDSSNVFVTTTAAGSLGVRRWSGSAWTTFSATACDSLAFLNNTLYGYRNDIGALIRYSTAGVAAIIYTWQDAVGAALTGAGYQTRLRPYGGKLLILRALGVRRPGELWTYDGTNTSEVADFPANFVASDLEVVNGIAFVAGYLNRGTDKLPAIYYYVNNNNGLLWKAGTSGYANATWPAMAGWAEGLAFTDDTTGSLLQYNIATGGVHTIGTYTVTNATAMMAANQNILLHTRNAAAGYYYPTSTLATTATLITSLFDFDNSLTKQFRGVKIDFDVPAGSTATFDIAYQVDSVDGAWTTLQTGATSGTEYTLTGVSGRAIAVRVTFNKGNATTSPRLKRVYIRASPQLQTYKRAEYVLDLTGVGGAGGGSSVRICRDGTPHPKNGAEQANDLVTAITATAPFSITDRVNGTFTGILEPAGCEIFEVHPALGEIGRGAGNVRSGVFVARITVREV